MKLKELLIPLNKAVEKNPDYLEYELNFTYFSGGLAIDKDKMEVIIGPLLAILGPVVMENGNK